MAYISSYDSSSISSLFASFGNNNNTASTSPMGLDFSTYSSIRNGSYKKLLTAYYAKADKTTEDDSDSTDKTNSTSSKQKVNATSVRDEAAALKDSVDALNKKELWEKKEVKNEDGSTVKKYDTDAIYKAVSSFVEEYNTLIDGTGNSSDNRVLRTAASMVSFTKANKDMLSRIGISINKNNKLEIDEEKFKKTDVAMVKSAFNGAGSYGRSVAGSASMIYGSAVSQLAKMASTSLYSNDGTFSYMTGSNYNRFL